MATDRQDNHAGIVSFATMHDAKDGAAVAVQHCAASTDLIAMLMHDWELEAKKPKKESDEHAEAIANRVMRVERRITDAIAQQYHLPGEAFKTAAENFLTTANAETAQEVKAAAESFKVSLGIATEELEKMGDVLTGRGYMHILRTTRFSEQQRGEMWSKMKGAGAYSVGVIIIVVAIGLTLDAVIGGGLFTLAQAAVAGALAIWGAGAVAAAATFMAANRMLAQGKKTVLDEVNKLKNADLKLMTATSKTTDAVVIMLAVLQRTQQFADDVVAACSVQPLNVWGIGHALTVVRNGTAELCPTQLSGNTLTTLISTQGKLQQYAPMADDDVPDPSDFVALFNPICKMPEEPIGKGTWGWKGWGHVSVLSRYEGSLKISVSDLCGIPMGQPKCIGCNTTYVASCNKVHVRITIVDEEAKPPKEYSWKRWGNSDWVVIKRSHDQELHIVDRTELSKLL